TQGDFPGPQTSGVASPGHRGERSEARKREPLDAAQASAAHNQARNRIDLAELKRVVSLEMVLAHYGVLNNLKRVGAQLAGCCPIHNGSNPKQFIVHLASNNWHCFGD